MNIKDKDKKIVKTLLSSSLDVYELLANETDLSLPIVYTVCLKLRIAGGNS